MSVAHTHMMMHGRAVGAWLAPLLDAAPALQELSLPGHDESDFISEFCAAEPGGGGFNKPVSAATHAHGPVCFRFMTRPPRSI